MAKLMLAAAIVAALSLVTSAAMACGGFFCMNQPVEQAGEKIAFFIDGDLVTAIIQIQYEGSAEDFSWILPLPSEPLDANGMRPGSEEIFVRLLDRTAPTFTINWNNANDCWLYWGMEQDMFLGADSEAAGEGGEGGGVQVLQVKEVGPYLATVVQSDDANALNAWLEENGYDQPPSADPLIAHYVAEESTFVALKLLSDKEAGDIAPITVTFANPDGACIPLVLTQIAATPDMPVFAWVFDETRTLPKNFFAVDINWGQIDWLNSGSNYVEVVTKAVNEAAGHGFVTDYAGPSEVMNETVYWEGRFNLESLKNDNDPASFYSAMIGAGIPVNSQTQALIKKHIPLPDNWSEGDQDFYCCLWQYDEYLSGLDFDPEAFVADLEEIVIKPIIEAQELMDSRPYLSRLFSTVSPEEMDRDPIFITNEEWPDISNEHVAEGTAICSTSEEGQQIVTAVQLILEDGKVITYDGSYGIWDPPGMEEALIDGDAPSTMPYASAIIMAGDDGSLSPVMPDYVLFEDNNLAVLGGSSSPAPADGTNPQIEVPADDETSRTGGCRQDSGSPWAGTALGLLLLSGALLGWRRRGQQIG